MTTKIISRIKFKKKKKEGRLLPAISSKPNHHQTNRLTIRSAYSLVKKLEHLEVQPAQAKTGIKGRV